MSQLTNVVIPMAADGNDRTIRVVRRYRYDVCQGCHLASWETPHGPGRAASAESRRGTQGPDHLLNNLATATALRRRQDHAVAA